MAKSTWKKTGREPTQTGQQLLFEVRKLTKELIKLANECPQSDANGVTTSARDLAAVRTLRHARKALLDSIKLASAAGVDSETIRIHGIDHAASTAIVMSELAHYVVGEIRSLV